MRNKFYTYIVCALLLAGCDVPNWMGSEKKEERLPGDRVSVMAFDQRLEPDSGMMDQPVELPALFQGPEWTQEHVNASSGYENLVLASPELNESASVGEGNAWHTILVATPVVANGKVFAMDAEGYVSAHSADDIDREIWVSPAPTREDVEDIVGGGLAYANEAVYVTTGYGSIYALSEKDGGVLWHKNIYTPVRAAPLVAGGRLFVVTVDNHLLVFNAANGKPLWKHKSSKESAVFLGAVSPAISDGIVIAAYASGDMYAIRAKDGLVLWSDSLVASRRNSATGSLTGIDATPIIKDGVVYTISNTGIFAANQLFNGRAVWETRLAGHLTPWLAGDYLYLVTANNELAAVRLSDGAVRWVTSLKQYEEGKDVTPRIYGPVMANDNLVVVSEAGEMLFLSPEDGALRTRYDIPDDIRTAPIIANGVMYLVDADAKLHAFK